MKGARGCGGVKEMGQGSKVRKKVKSEGILKLSGIRTGRELVLINPRCFVQWRGVGKNVD